MQAVLEIENLSKRYGRIRAVNGLCLRVEKGNVYGLLGPNGCGKTTTLGMILDVVKPDGGLFRWFGEAPRSETRKQIGAILEHPVFYPYLSACENLRLVAAIKGADEKDIDRVLEIVGLIGRKRSRFRTFSYGMRQRLAIASALLGAPEVLIFDEPTNGLDPRGIAEIRELIISIARQGLTIILASHLLDEVQKTCSHVAIMNQGSTLFQGSVSEVLNPSDTYEISCPDAEALAAALDGCESVSGVTREDGLFVVKLLHDTGSHDLNRYLFEKGIAVSHLARRKGSLEKQFLDLLQEGHAETPQN